MSPISLLVPLCFAAGPLTIDAAVERALSRAPELLAAKHGERAAEKRVEQARAAYYPRISVEAGYLAKWPKNELPIDLSALQNIPGLPEVGDVDDVHHFNAGVHAGIVLFDLTRGAKVEALEQHTNAERQKTAESEASLAFQTRSTFLAALYARDVASISERSLSIAREEEARARLRQEVGTGTEVALAQSRVRRSALDAQSKRANHDLLRYRAQLGSLIGDEEIPEISGELESLVSSSSISKDRLARSPAVLRLHALRDAALASAKARSRTLVPTVSAMGKAELQYPRPMKLETGPVLSAGINLSWLVFDGFSRSAGIDEAEAQASLLDESIRATEEALSRRLIELDARRRTATADLGSARESQQQAEVYVRAAKAAVESGTGTELELNTAKNTLDQANVAVSQALFARAIVDAEELVIYGVTK
jgi:outer membrane protein TolC